MEAIQVLISTYDKINLAALTSKDAVKNAEDMANLRATAEELKKIDSERFNFVTDGTDADLMLSVKNFIAKQF